MTDRGWGVVGAGIAAIVLWILLGEVELLAAGTTIIGVVVAAWIAVIGGEPEISIVRHIRPNRVIDGEMADVESLVTNHRNRALLNVSVIDDVETLGSAGFDVGRIGGKETVHVSYRVLCRPRGVYVVGPATIQLSDPAGLVARRVKTTGTDRLVVYPVTEPLTGFPPARGKDPTTAAAKPEFSNRSGEDFYTLREYSAGDDLRRIHWPSSAKRDDLLIRQLETPWQQRALLFFDTRQDAYQTEACFEHAVRGMASVVSHFRRGGYQALTWAGGVDPIPVHHYGAVMEQLATLRPERRLDLRAVASRIRQQGGGGALVLVTGTPDPVLADISRLLSRDYGAAITLCATETSSPTITTLQRAGTLTIESAPGGSWARAWMRRGAWSSSAAY